MTPDKLFSPVEHKIFFGIAFLLCCLFFVNLTSKTVAGYNESVERTQIQKRDYANNEWNISFGMCVFKNIRAYDLILGLQFFTNPLLLLLFLKRNFRTFVFSALLASFTFYGYFSWMIDSHQARKHAGLLSLEDTTFNSYLLYNSTVPDFILFLTFAVLLVLQAAVLTRFAIEKFQARIYLR